MIKKGKGKKVFVGMSGGVDSSVAALLLKQQGYDVYGAFIRGFNVDGCQDKDAEDARLVAEKLGIPFYVLDCEQEYKERVVDYLVQGYQQGITPNPDVMCNTEIKFGIFYDYAKQMGCDYVATGHYARITHPSLFISEARMWTARDSSKDQTYFLWNIAPTKIANILFPLGNLLKTNVRALAKKAGLCTAEKKDSQGICFLGKCKFDEFLQQYCNTTEGYIIDTAGKKVGTHKGAVLYTIGQRHGFNNHCGKPFFVIKKDLVTNTLIVAYGDDLSSQTHSFSVHSINIFSCKHKKMIEDKKSFACFVRVRYRQSLVAITVVPHNDQLELVLKNPQSLFAAAGQSAVLYTSTGQVIGGGIIS